MNKTPDTLRGGEVGVATSYGATPFLWSEQQRDVFFELRERVKKSRLPNIPGIVHKHVVRHFETRFSKRQSRQTESYNARLNRDVSIFSPKERAMIHRAECGKASPKDLLVARSLLGMGDVELGRVTHPYGEHMDDLYTLRGNTQDAISELGGHIFSEEDYETFEVEANDRIVTEAKMPIASLLVVRTRLVGVTPDMTEIYERSSFILRIDAESGFDQQIATQLRIAQDTQPDTFDDEVNKVFDLAAYARPLLKSDNFSAAIPLSSTVFAVNAQTKSLIEDRDSKILASLSNTIFDDEMF